MIPRCFPCQIVKADAEANMLCSLFDVPCFFSRDFTQFPAFAELVRSVRISEKPKWGEHTIKS